MLPPLPLHPHGLRVAAIELPARWNQAPTALAEVDRRLGEGPAADLVLLPEASVTGYVSPAKDFDLAPFAEPLDGPTGRALAELAKRHGCYLAGPVIERDGALSYNALVVVGPDGERIAHYRKRHPWYPETWATAGERPPAVFDVKGFLVTVAVCFDVQFVTQDAEAELRAADVLLFPSAWVERPDSRETMLADLARRFDVAIVNANWGVGQPRVPGQGASRIVGRDGATLALAREAGRIDARLDAAGREPC